jgi:hypothetical protein
MVDEKPRLSKEERWQRQRAWDQARRRRGTHGTAAVSAENTDVAAPSSVPPARRRGRRKRREVTVADVTGLGCFA